MYKSVVGIIFAFVSLVTFADGDPERGKDLIATCTACHAQDGNSPSSAFPSIAGQGEEYLVKQMMNMKQKDDEGNFIRDPGAMTGMLDSLSEQDIEDLAAYYANQAPEYGAANPDLVALGEKIYRAGIRRKDVTACTACHSPRGGGVDAAKFPALAGQWPEYTIAQLKAFRSGKRHNDGDGQMMRSTAMDLSDQEIEAVASYIYGLR